MHIKPIKHTALALLCCTLAAPAFAQTNTPPAAAKPAPTVRAKPAPAATAPATAQPTAKPAAKPTAQPTDPALAEIAKAGLPNEHHDRLELMAGEWDCAVRVNYTGTWSESKATTKSHMRLGGRYLVSNFQGDFAGTPMNGQQIIGYNNLTGKYESVWRDNISTGMMIEYGTADASGKVITTEGECTGPDGKPAKTKTVCTISGETKYTVQSFTPGPDGKDMLVFEMTCTRTKAPGKGAAAADSDMDDLQNEARKMAKDAINSAKPK